jgi:hypothetical protein
MDHPGVTRLLLDDCTQILADTQQQVGDYSRMWTALQAAEVRRSRPQTGLAARVRKRLAAPDAPTFAEDFTRRRNEVPADRAFFIGTIAGGIRFLGDARDFPSGLHAMTRRPTASSSGRSSRSSRAARATSSTSGPTSAWSRRAWPRTWRRRVA